MRLLVSKDGSDHLRGNVAVGQMVSVVGAVGQHWTHVLLL